MVRDAEREAAAKEMQLVKEELPALAERLDAASAKNAAAREAAAAAAAARATAAADVPVAVAVPVAEVPPKHEGPSQERLDLDALRADIESVRGEAETVRKDKVERLEKEVRRDLEVVLSEDLSSLDEAGLRRRIVQLVLELRDRNKWEVLRMHDMTRLHTEELASKYEALLRKLESKYEDVIRQESLSAAERATETASRTLKEEHERTLSELDGKWKAFTHERLASQQEKLRAELEKRIEAVRDEAAEAASAEREERMGKFAQLRAEAERVRGVIKKQGEYLESARRFNKTVLAAEALESCIAGAKPLKGAADALRSLCKHDPVLRGAAGDSGARPRKWPEHSKPAARRVRASAREEPHSGDFGGSVWRLGWHRLIVDCYARRGQGRAGSRHFCAYIFCAGYG